MDNFVKTGGAMIKKCPVCKSKLIVKELECLKCNTRILGKFETSEFNNINTEIMDFIKLFIFTEGSIKKVEKILNCSYPKVKSLLKKAKLSLGVDNIESNSIDDDEKEKILNKLDKGEITFDQALKLLNQGK